MFPNFTLKRESGNDHDHKNIHIHKYIFMIVEAQVHNTSVEPSSPVARGLRRCSLKDPAIPNKIYD
jgi:hypothetical protein